MVRISRYLLLSCLFLTWQVLATAEDVVVPAGTLLHCTLDEPNFSSATAEVGDPVVCHLRSLQEFGRVVFPRGSYLAGHLESDKEPGHFYGKGNLKIQFDRIGLPSSEIPVPSKVIAAHGYKVDKAGEVVGKGHPKRDVVEWMLPPLWPWKVMTLPARGPRPTMKGEEQITLRLMDDIVVPSASAPTPGWHRFGEPTSYNTPSRNDSSQNASYTARPASNATSFAASTSAKPSRETLLAVGSDVLSVSKYRIDNGAVNYVLPDGGQGTVSVNDVDWRTTTQLNANHVQAPAQNPAWAKSTLPETRKGM
jgi:hypothetical protein